MNEINTMKFYALEDNAFRIRASDMRRPRGVMEEYTIEISDEKLSSIWLSSLYPEIKNGKRRFI